MYLATADKTIEKKEKEIYKLNKQIIADWKKQPFLKGFLTEENVKKQVITNWIEFRNWMYRRINNKMKL